MPPRSKNFKKIKPRRQRLYFVLFSGVCLALAAYFIANQFKDNLMFFVTPSQIVEKNIGTGKTFKLGGLVKEKSIQEIAPSQIKFVVTDKKTEITVQYKGITPSLFREGQGVIATGKIDESGIFTATEILAKHDEKYMPKEVYEKIRKNEEEMK